MFSIDLNSDLGEGLGSWHMGDDAALLSIVSSANIACGFHAGDARTMLRTTRLAAENGIRIGAHVAYRDLAGFGRRHMDYASEELTAETLYQIGALQSCAAAAGTRVSYVKPHGALYNRIARDEQQASAVVEAIADARPLLGSQLALMVQPGTVVAEIAQSREIPLIYEAFADRAYNPDGTLVSRSEPGAVIEDPEAVVARVVALTSGKPISAIDGTLIDIPAASVCIHGDTPGAVALARRIRQGIEDAGATVRPQETART